MWIYNADANEWILVWGNVNASVPPSYGTLGLSSGTNSIPPRNGMCIWTDMNENLWVFGGFGRTGRFNDMWRFTPDTSCFDILKANSIYLPTTDYTICEGEELTISFPPHSDIEILPNEFLNYNKTSGKLILFPNHSTSYAVIGRAVPDVNCSFQDTININVQVKPLPKASFHFDREITFPSNTNFTTINTSKNALAYSWVQDGTFISSDKNISIPADQTGTYCLTLHAANECGIDSMEVCARVMGNFLIPNAFSPNHDQINDVLHIIGSSEITLKKFTIYNRWGQKVFETKDIHQGWDGKMNNQDCQMGLYFYIAAFEGIDQLFKGDITLIR